MRIEWLNKKGNDKVLLFFNGWGMDSAVVSHLKTDCDVVMFYHYCQEDFVFPDLSNYRKVYLIAWSMGVWAASYYIKQVDVRLDRCIAINGTSKPVDDEYGIPEKVYELTEKGMNERGREKFFFRMLDGTEEQRRFVLQKPSRELSDQCEELLLIHKNCTGALKELNWDKVFVSDKDLIFPQHNQFNWCRKLGMHPISIKGGHYPFYQFQRWEDILEK